ncbi:MAG: metallophosphoesterase [Clostridia bacterium]|nr:metallophosphoesterase [Clostridia bacterium]
MKKHNGKKVMKVFGIIIAVFVIIGIAGTIANKVYIKNTLEYIKKLEPVVLEDRLSIEKDTDGFYTIISDRDVKIVQLTDIHLGGGWMSKKDDYKVIDTIATMVAEEKPDIVIATGDISYPIPFTAGTFNNQYAARIFATVMETLNIPWTVTFGNHDSEIYSIYNREKMGEFYSSDEWKNCLYLMDDESIDGVGNSVIKVKNSDGVITQALITIDSNDYPQDNKFAGLVAGITGNYDNIHENQIDWYKTTCERLNADNKAFIEKTFEGDEQTHLLEKYGLVKSLVFMHIPPVEYQQAWDEFKANGYKDTENVKYYYGTLGEKVCHPTNDDQFFEAALELGSTQGMFVGHDHINIFSLDYKGIRLTYGMSIDYTAYSKIDTKGTQRGCTVITVKPDGTFDCYPENYYQDKYANPDKEQVTMQVLNEEFSG